MLWGCTFLSTLLSHFITNLIFFLFFFCFFDVLPGCPKKLFLISKFNGLKGYVSVLIFLGPFSELRPRPYSIFFDFWKVLNLFNIKYKFLGFPGGAAVEGLPADAGDTGSSPGPGRPHMPRSNMPVSQNYWACASGACAPQQERPR